MSQARFKCRVCGKLTAGRQTDGPRNLSDLSERYPRRHKVGDAYCPGIYEEADWVEVDEAGEPVAEFRGQRGEEDLR